MRWGRGVIRVLQGRMGQEMREESGGENNSVTREKFLMANGNVLEQST